MPAPRDRRGVGWIVFAAAGVAGLVSFFTLLENHSAVGDELTYIRAAQAYLDGNWQVNQEHPPLAKLMIGLGAVLGDGSLVAFRMVGAVLGWATGLLLGLTAFVISRRALVGAVAGALWWMLPIAPGIVMHHSARIASLDGPQLFWIAAGMLACAVAARTGQRRWWLVVAVCAGLAGASKLTGLVVLAGLLPLAVAAVAGARSGPAERRRTLVTVLGLLALATLVTALTFLLTYLPAGPEAAGWIRETFVFQIQHAAAGHVQTVAGVNYTHPPWWTHFWFQAQYLGWVPTVALWVAAVFGAVRHRRSVGLQSVALMVLVGLVALVISPLKLPQYHALVIPGLCVLAGMALLPARSPVRPPGTRRPAVLVGALLPLVLITVLLGRGFLHVGSVVTQEPEDYRAAADYIMDNWGESTPIALWGQARVARWHLPGYEMSAELADQDPQLLLADLSVVYRREGIDLDAWVREHGDRYDRHEFQHVVLFERRG